MKKGKDGWGKERNTIRSNTENAQNDRAVSGAVRCLEDKISRKSPDDSCKMISNIHFFFKDPQLHSTDLRFHWQLLKMMHLLHAGSSLWSQSLCVVMCRAGWAALKASSWARPSINSALSRSFDTGDYKLGWIKYTFWISHKILAVRRIQRFLKREWEREIKRVQCKWTETWALQILAVLPSPRLFPSDTATFTSIFPTRMVLWDFNLWEHHWNTIKIICNNDKL